LSSESPKLEKFFCQTKEHTPAGPAAQIPVVFVPAQVPPQPFEQVAPTQVLDSQEQSGVQIEVQSPAVALQTVPDAQVLTNSKFLQPTLSPHCVRFEPIQLNFPTWQFLHDPPESHFPESALQFGSAPEQVSFVSQCVHAGFAGLALHS
jgi:hypothetical protein